ncbi:MAG: DUF493 domain-containing protein [Smithellaceae bacterium]|nr:DUF493 domain-containing protein [Smithellaceae bacterium]
MPEWQDINERPVVVYPCRWLYKIIGSDREEMMRAVKATLSDRPHQVSLSRHSSTGRYVCLNVEISVSSDDERLTIYDGLRNNPAIKIVL